MNWFYIVDKLPKNETMVLVSVNLDRDPWHEVIPAQYDKEFMDLNYDREETIEGVYAWAYYPEHAPIRGARWINPGTEVPGDGDEVEAQINRTGIYTYHAEDHENPGWWQGHNGFRNRATDEIERWRRG